VLQLHYMQSCSFCGGEFEKGAIGGFLIP